MYKIMCVVYKRLYYSSLRPARWIKFNRICCFIMSSFIEKLEELNKSVSHFYHNCLWMFFFLNRAMNKFCIMCGNLNFIPHTIHYWRVQAVLESQPLCFKPIRFESAFLFKYKTQSKMVSLLCEWLNLAWIMQLSSLSVFCFADLEFSSGLSWEVLHT